MAQVKAGVTEATKNDLKQLAKQRGETESNLVRKAIQNFIEDSKKPRVYQPIKDYGGRM